MLTGRHVLICLLGFFFVVVAVNGVLAYLALSTFDGYDVPDAYRKGRDHDREIAAAAAQAERGWRVTLSHEQAVGGWLDLKMTAKDALGHSVTGLRVEASFKRPTLAALDLAVPLREVRSGLYREAVQLPQPGQWILQLDAYRDGARLYRTQHRVLVK